MTRLAIEGGKPAVTGKIRPFSTIGHAEIQRVTDAMLQRPLSGFLGGGLHGGPQVRLLEEMWCSIFGCKHAVAVNSATSGLLVACMAAGVRIESGMLVYTTPYTMSATAAAPALLGADIRFGDIDDRTFCLQAVEHGPPDVVIVTNLFGHPAELRDWRVVCDGIDGVLIEDNAQAIFAREHGNYAGTIGHMGVYSLNVHKHLQCGEGGIVVTDVEHLAHLLRLYRNHAELSELPIGLNLRMTEPTAAIAIAQLGKREKIMAGRMELAEELTDMVKDYPHVRAPVVRDGCTHSYYLWCPIIGDGRRDRIVAELAAEGVPLKAGYVDPLYNLPAFRRFRSHCPVTERVEKEIACFEVCGYDPSAEQRKQFREAFKKVLEPAWVS